jgi:hypothetical protein
MKNLSNTVHDYYFSHLDSLSEDSKFHLASRLYLWSQDAAARTVLEEMKAWFTHDGKPELSLTRAIEEVRANPYGKVSNAIALRRPYFEKYPLLRSCNVCLIRMATLKSLFDIDLGGTFFTYFDKPEVEAMRTSLLADTLSLSMLSTYGINFLYLYDRLVCGDEDRLPVRRLLEVGQHAYNLDDSSHLMLLQYLYTHCIIGESLFYSRRLPTANGDIYRRMIKELEQVMKPRLSGIHLDNKFEFLVAARLCNVDSELAGPIFEEAEHSLAPDQDFLIDRYNSAVQRDRSTLDKGEHRNVLFMMAGRPFTPLKSEERLTSNGA